MFRRSVIEFVKKKLCFPLSVFWGLKNMKINEAITGGLFSFRSGLCLIFSPRDQSQRAPLAGSHASGFKGNHSLVDTKHFLP